MRNLSSSRPKHRRENPSARSGIFDRRAGNDEYRSVPASRIYIVRETHDTPESAARRLIIAGGTNRFGEANYRAVWGWNRLAWIGGKFEDRNERGALLREVVELRQEPKYPQVNRWHIERWVPPETYGSPRAWYSQTIEHANGRSVPALGPYPSRGDYEHCFTLETPRGEFIQLTATIAEYVARAIECSRGARASLSRAISLQFVRKGSARRPRLLRLGL